MKINFQKVIVFIALYIITFIVDILAFAFTLNSLNISPPTNLAVSYILIFWMFIGLPSLVSTLVIKKYISRVTPLLFGLSLGSILLFLFGAGALIFQPYTPQLALVSISHDELDNLGPIASDGSSQPTRQPTATIVPLQNLDLGAPKWLQFPKPVTLAVFDKSAIDDNGGCYSSKNAKFHQTASFTDGSILVNAYITYTCGMGEYVELLHFVKKTDGTIFLVDISPDDNQGDSELFNVLIPEIKHVAMKIEGLETPETISLEKSQFKRGYRVAEMSFATLQNPRLIASTPFGRLYGIKSEFDSNIYERSVYLRLKDDTLFSYNLVIPFIKDDHIPAVTFSDGTRNTVYYEVGLRGGGCGMRRGNLIDDSPAFSSKLVTVGTTSNGDPIFALNDPASPILKAIYDTYIDTRATSEERESLTLTDFAKLKSHFIWKDSLDTWNLFISENYTSGAECAKPVIYLYPQQDTEVTVQVSAAITQSDPLYPKEGWTVLARPNGNLTYQNRSYPYLFWEGKGTGQYPNTAKTGTVVAQKDVVDTLHRQLEQLGLNAQESADFMEFWQPLLPKTPYVRLTWLTTSDMDRLAPLTVQPKPDTNIRVFLDFEGMDQPVSLRPQNLTAPKRTGFTLIEWGGLRIKN